ncbi:hypothetical protein HOF92_10190 [bacterium]|jgi:hypothetical protein|nr:hypothetical protein [bacterium]
MNLSRAFSLIGSALLLSYSFLLLIQTETNDLLLWIACGFILISFWLGRSPRFRNFYSLHSNSQFHLKFPAVAPPSRGEGKVLFLLQNGFIEVRDLHNSEKSFSHCLPIKWECVPPLVLKRGFAAWARGQFVVLGRDGQKVSSLSVPFQAVSLTFQKGSSLFVGSTQEFLHVLKNNQTDWKSYPVAGVPVSWHEKESLLFTSTGSLYKISNHEPQEIRPSKGEPLGFFALGECRVFFTSSLEIYYELGDRQISLGHYHRDFLYPFKNSDRGYFVDRKRRFCVLNPDGELLRSHQFDSSPIWVRHGPKFLVVAFSAKGKVSLFVWNLGLESLADPLNFEAAGGFMPLGMGEDELFFSICAENWYRWRLNEAGPQKMPGEAPEQVLVNAGKYLVGAKEKWRTFEGDLPDCKLPILERNYEYQSTGIFPIS